MIRIMETCQVKTEDILKRETAATDMADKVAAEIIADVEARGDEALFEYCEKFDKVTLKALEVSQAEIDEAVNAVSDELKETMKKSAENIRFFNADARDIKKIEGRRGTVACNPPYGERLLTLAEAERLYKDMGKAFAQLSPWQIYVLTSAENFERLYGRRADKIRKLYNGMIPCRLYQYFKPQ
jgi:putative N6-adenine-specific DNA methylase